MIFGNGGKSDSKQSVISERKKLKGFSFDSLSKITSFKKRSFKRRLVKQSKDTVQCNKTDYFIPKWKVDFWKTKRMKEIEHKKMLM